MDHIKDCSMENTICIICGGNNDATHFITLSDRLTKSRKKFNLLYCSCGLLYLNPRPKSDEIYKYYNLKDYNPHNESNAIWYLIYQSIVLIHACH